MEKIPYRIETAKDGNATVIVQIHGRDMPLHSRVSPMKEASAEILIDTDRFDTAILLGTGLGYHLTQLEYSLNKLKTVIAIDALAGIENHIMQNSSLPFLADSKITYLTGLDPENIESRLTGLIDFENTKGVQVIEHSQSVRVMTSYYSKIREAINRVINKKASDRASIKAFGNIYLKNALLNLRMMDIYSGVNNFFGRFKNLPAIVVASGPSLDRYADSLKKISEKAFIISVDSSAGPLAARGIYADFILSIDPQPYIAEHLREIKSGRGAYIFSMAADHKSMKKHSGFLSMTTHPVCQFIEEISPGCAGSSDSSTGNVSGDAILFAIKAGFSPIGIMGLDFSFSDYAIYARGSAYQNRYAKIFQTRTMSVETANFNYIMKSSGGITENGLHTRKSFLHYKNSVEKLIREQGTGTIFNINGFGLDISGTEAISANDFHGKIRGLNLNKTEMISAVARGARPLSENINTDKIKSLLASSLAERIIQASLGKEPPEKVRRKFLKLMENL